MLFEHKGTVGETRVAEGKLYQSDNPTYDEFFQGVNQLQTQTKEALEEEGEARAPLERALGTRNTSPDHLGELMRERLKGKNHEGAPVRIMVIGLDPPKEGDKSTKKVEVTVSVPDDAAIVTSQQRDLVKSLEESAKSEADVASKYGAASAKARGLLTRLGKLSASVDQDFTTPARREEVLLELKASKPILFSAAERAEKASTTARSFLKAMADALPLSGEPVLPAAPPAEDKTAVDKTPGKSQRKSGAVAAAPAKPASAAQPPKPKPQPAAKPPSEAPAPKPEPPPKPAAKAPSEDFNP
jgi:hypothetical protein